jgi:hypothetical protein
MDQGLEILGDKNETDHAIGYKKTQPKLGLIPNGTKAVNNVRLSAHPVVAHAAAYVESNTIFSR